MPHFAVFFSDGAGFGIEMVPGRCRGRHGFK
jgi:hypothetical protein